MSEVAAIIDGYTAEPEALHVPIGRKVTAGTRVRSHGALGGS